MAKGFKTGGRKRGQPNKVTSLVKDAIQLCYDEMGGLDAFVNWAQNNQTDFYKHIYPKLLPFTLAGDVESPFMEKIVVEFVDSQ